MQVRSRFRVHASSVGLVQTDTAASLSHSPQVLPRGFDAVHVDPVVVEVAIPEHLFPGTESLADAQGLLLLAIQRCPAEDVVASHHPHDHAVHGTEDELVSLRVIELSGERAGVVDHDIQAGDVPQEGFVDDHRSAGVEAGRDVADLADVAVETNGLVPAYFVVERLAGGHVYRERVTVADCQGRIAINRDGHPAVVTLVELCGRDDLFRATGPIQGPALLVAVLDAEAQAATERQQDHQAQTRDDLTHVSTSQGSGVYLLALE